MRVCTHECVQAYGEHEQQQQQAYGEHEQQQQQAAHGSPGGQQQLPAACKAPQAAYPHISQICKVDAACLFTTDMLPAGP